MQFLAERLPRGLRIVDVGANTGNHTLFFASVMQAERVIPIEPHPARSGGDPRRCRGEPARQRRSLAASDAPSGGETGRLRAIPSDRRTRRDHLVAGPGWRGSGHAAR